MAGWINAEARRGADRDLADRTAVATAIRTAALRALLQRATRSSATACGSRWSGTSRSPRTRKIDAVSRRLDPATARTPARPLYDDFPGRRRPPGEGARSPDQSRRQGGRVLRQGAPGPHLDAGPAGRDGALRRARPEGINNLAHALILKEFAARELGPKLAAHDRRDRRARAPLQIRPRCSRGPTGRRPRPTTMGKELAVFAARLDRQRRHLDAPGIPRQAQRGGGQLQRPSGRVSRGGLDRAFARVRRRAWAWPGIRLPRRSRATTSVAELFDTLVRIDTDPSSASRATCGAISRSAILRRRRRRARPAPRRCRTRSMRSTSKTPRAIWASRPRCSSILRPSFPDLAMAARL